MQAELRTRHVTTVAITALLRNANAFGPPACYRQNQMKISACRQEMLFSKLSYLKVPISVYIFDKMLIIVRLSFTKFCLNKLIKPCNQNYGIIEYS